MRDVPFNTVDGQFVPAIDFNSLFAELENWITKGGLVLGDPVTQLGEALSIHAQGGSTFYTDEDSGVNVYTLSPGVSNSPLLFGVPDGYANLMRVSFLAISANTGSTQVNVDGLGLVELVLSDGSSLVGGEVSAGAYIDLVYDSGLLKFVLAETSDFVLQGSSGGGDSSPVGTVGVCSFNTLPSGWVFCDGSAYDTTTYAALFAEIGYTFGGAGSSFNVPDLRGRQVKGDPDGVITNSSGGDQSVVITLSTLGTHYHHTSDPYHSIQGSFYPRASSGSTRLFDAGTSVSSGLQDTFDSGSGGAHNNTQPGLILNYVIKAEN